MMNYKEYIESDQLYLNNPEGERLKGEIALWRAVIIRAFDDLKLPISNKKYRRWRNDATNWFIEADENFCAVCENANISVETVLTIAYGIISKRNSEPSYK